MAQSSPTPIRVTPATLAEVSRLSHVHLAAWLTNNLYSTIYYTGYSQSLLDANIQRHTTAFTTDPSCRYLICVLDEQLIAFAKINIFSSHQDIEDRKDTHERIWPVGINLKLVELFWGQLQNVRRTWGPRLGPHVQVDLVGTDPDYMRRGAGKALMKAICEIADAEGLPGFLEGSPDAEALYASVGFVTVGAFWVDLGRFPHGKDKGQAWRREAGLSTVEGEGEGWYKQVVMIRPAKRSRIEDYVNS